MIAFAYVGFGGACSRRGAEGGRATLASVSSADAAPEADGLACGAAGCRRYATAESAFRAVLDERPRVLGIGESHAQKGEGAAPSATRLFTERLLPMLAGKTSDLVVELMLPPVGCPSRAEAVREAQKPVTAPQADHNQDDYVALGAAARKLGIAADALRPSCADLAAIEGAGDDAVTTMLATIARLTTAKVESLLARDLGAEAMIVTYGGALHNDLVPRPGRESWSFGPALSRASASRYLELDVFAPEAVRDTEAWRSFPWYAAYDPTARPDRATLFHPAPGSYTLVLPRSPAAPATSARRTTP